MELVAKVARLLTGADGQAGLEALGLVRVHRTRGGGREIALNGPAEATPRR